jgi:hypothetical protein
MCINKEVSISAFIVCSVTCIYLYKRNLQNDRWIAIIFGYFGTMQLLEYLMWIDQECSGLNQIATDLAFIHNILQPMVSLLVAYIMIRKIPKFAYIVLGIYILVSFPRIWEAKKENQCSKPCSEENIGLSWEYTLIKDNPYMIWFIFAIALATPFLLMKKNGHIYASIIMGTFISSHFIARHRCPNVIVSSPTGSWWCLMASLVPLSAVYINK